MKDNSKQLVSDFSNLKYEKLFVGTCRSFADERGGGGGERYTKYEFEND